MDTERESITREVGSRIRYARKSRGMSMEELAQAIYKTRSAISKYENGQISVDIATLYGCDMWLYHNQKGEKRVGI